MVDEIQEGGYVPSHVEILLERYNSTGLVDLVAVGQIHANNIKYFPTEYFNKLLLTLFDMVRSDPFDVLTVHDCFSCSPDNVDAMRYHYKSVLADLANSTALDDVLTQLKGKPCYFPKLSNNMSSDILNSSYALS